MGEIDTKPIESVQAAISLFGARSDQRRNKSPTKDELEKEEELENLLKDCANIKIQLEAKDSEHKQTLLQLEHYQKMVDELSTLLKSSELEKEIYLDECKEAKMRASESESTAKDIADQLAEYIREQRAQILRELRATEEQVLRLETEIAAEKDAKLESMKQVEELESAISMEKLKTVELSKQVLELNETIMHLKLAVAQTEKEKDSIISRKEMKIQLAEAATMEAQEQVQSLTKRVEMMRSLEKQILEKAVYIEALQKELRKANELHVSSEKAAFDAICELNQLKADLELKEGKISEQANYINLLETELQKIKLERNTAKEEIKNLASNVEEMKNEIETMKRELTEAKEKEREAEDEIALLKSELHEGRSRIAAAEAAEERAKSEKSALYVSLQQLELEAEETKMENQRLKVAAKIAEESENYFTPYIQDEDSTKSKEGDKVIRISNEEYGALIKMAKQVEVLKPGHECGTESENLKRELEIAKSKVAEFRTRAEQAISRAESAEKAKATLEERIKKSKERREKKKASVAALQEESISKEITIFRYSGSPQKVYQPLGKVLNMKF